MAGLIDCFVGSNRLSVHKGGVHLIVWQEKNKKIQRHTMKNKGDQRRAAYLDPEPVPVKQEKTLIRNLVTNIVVLQSTIE